MKTTVLILMFVLLIPHMAYAACSGNANVQAVQNDCAGASCNTAFAANITVGNTVLVSCSLVSSTGATTPTISSMAMHAGAGTCKSLSAAATGSGSNYVDGESWYCTNISGGPTAQIDITISTASEFGSCILEEVSGLATTATVENTFSATGTGTSMTTGSTTPTTFDSCDYLWTGLAWPGANATAQPSGCGGATCTHTSPWADTGKAIYSGTTPNAFPDAAAIPNATPTTYSDSVTQAGSQPWVRTGGALLASGVTSTPTPSPTPSPTPTPTPTAMPTSSPCVVPTRIPSASRVNALANINNVISQIDVCLGFGAATPSPTPTATPTPSPTATPGGCTNIPTTSVPVGAACISSGSFPALVNPVNPVSFGADATGVADSTSAFQTAVNTSDTLVSTAGTYVINGTVTIPSGKNLRCASGVTLISKRTTCPGNFCAMLQFAQANGGSVTGCTLDGGNTGLAPMNNTLEGDQVLNLIDSSNITVEGNTCQNSRSDSCITISAGGANTGGSNDLIQFNTVPANGQMGISITAGTHHIIQNNLVTDSNIDIEPNINPSGPSTTPPIGFLTVTNNQIKYVKGNCARNGQSGCNTGIWITGGLHAGMNASSVTVSNNYCSGTDGVQSANILNGTPSGGVSASYSGDILGPSCYCAAGGTTC